MVLYFLRFVHISHEEGMETATTENEKKVDENKLLQNYEEIKDHKIVPLGAGKIHQPSCYRATLTIITSTNSQKVIFGLEPK